ncbi:hypothetical protein BX600DRAFT_477784 [Xylariales sp. PMI_506]|nr:hypothetical protein BX600DRAFT_477784 [Xylariales sp. PMI_506]
MYQKCDEYRGKRVGYVLVVRDGLGGTFGAYLTEAPHIGGKDIYYGTGECFLWRASIHIPLPPPPSADTSDILTSRSTTIAVDGFTSQNGSLGGSGGGSNNNSLAPPSASTTPTSLSHPLPQQHSVRFQSFSYTGENEYYIHGERGYLSVGGGIQAAHYGLWLDEGFSRGQSRHCDTFNNAPLSDEGEKFDIVGVELWVVGADNITEEDKRNLG